MRPLTPKMPGQRENTEFIRTTALYSAVGAAIAKRAIAAGWLGAPLLKKHNYVVWRADAVLLIRRRISLGDYPPPLASELANRAKWARLRTRTSKRARKRRSHKL